MSLKKRKTPLTELWPERENLRVKPIAKKRKDDTILQNKNKR